MSEDFTKQSLELAQAHVDWYLKSIRPLLIDHMVHGFKHGVKYQQQDLFDKIDSYADESIYREVKSRIEGLT